MMEENAMWLVYAYGLYTDLSKLVNGYLAISLLTMVVAWMPFMVLFRNPGDALLIKMTKFITTYYKIAAVVLLLNALVPSRNTLVMMVSAEPLLQTVKSVRDSNTTKSLVNILDNSVRYLEKRSEELTEGNK